MTQSTRIPVPGERVRIYERSREQRTLLGESTVEKVTKTFVVVDGVKYRTRPTKGTQRQGRWGRRWREGGRSALTAIDDSGRYIACAVDEEHREIRTRARELTRDLGRFDARQLLGLVRYLEAMDGASDDTQ